MRMESRESYSLQIEMLHHRHNPDGFFYEKRYVVLVKTIRCFSSTDVSF